MEHKSYFKMLEIQFVVNQKLLYGRWLRYTCQSDHPSALCTFKHDKMAAYRVILSVLSVFQIIYSLRLRFAQWRKLVEAPRRVGQSLGKGICLGCALVSIFDFYFVYTNFTCVLICPQTQTLSYHLSVG